MELIVFVGALCMVGVLATCFGHDSRMPAQSKEQDLANLGLSWEDQSGYSRPTLDPSTTVTANSGRCDSWLVRSCHQLHRQA